MATRKSSSAIGRTVTVVIIVCLIALAGFSVRMWKFYEARLWKYEGSFHVLDSTTLTLNVYAYDRQHIQKIQLPEDVYLDVPGGYGFYKLKDIGPLSAVEKKGEELLLNSVMSTMGVPIESTVTTLPFWDRLVTLWITKMNHPVEDTIDIADYPVFDTEKRNDGVEINKMDPRKIDVVLPKLFWESSLPAEDISVGVYNGGETAGLATVTSRLLERLGIRVVAVDNWEEQLSGNCELRVDPSLSRSKTFIRLVSLFPRCEQKEQTTEARFGIQLIVTDVPWSQQ
ncbi:LytR C-terminal domain-containing protein [Candidatus Roizmanbacteria bacterium]|nr:LytR C-terminal domain-containing protein [Candidatus Roizmanbacteria bacterium]